MARPNLLVGRKSTVIVNHNTTPVGGTEAMITLRKRLTGARAHTLLPALLFLGAASLSAFGAGSVALLCLLPAGLVLDAAGRDPRPAGHRTPDDVS